MAKRKRIKDGSVQPQLLGVLLLLHDVLNASQKRAFEEYLCELFRSVKNSKHKTARLRIFVLGDGFDNTLLTKTKEVLVTPSPEALTSGRKAHGSKPTLLTTWGVNQDHIYSCKECEAVDNAGVLPLNAIRLVETTVGSRFRGKEKEELEHIATLSQTLQQQLDRYVAHSARGKWQHARIRDLKLEILATPKKRREHMVATLDFNKKILQMRRAESMIEYCAKKGISLLGVLLEYADDDIQGAFLLRFLDVVFSNGLQDEFCMFSCMKVVSSISLR